MNISYNEFHISRKVRDLCKFDKTLYSSTGNVVFKDLKAVRLFQEKLNTLFDQRGESAKRVGAGNLNAMGLIDEIFHYVCMLYRKNKAPLSFKNLLEDLDTEYKNEEVDKLLLSFMEEFPPVAVYQGQETAEEYLARTCLDEGTQKERTNREQVLEEMILLNLANENPAMHQFQILFDDEKLKENPLYTKAWNKIKAFFKTQPVFGPFSHDLITMLKEPVVASPTSLKGQLDYIRSKWGDMLGEWLRRLLAGIDAITEEEKAMWHPTNGGDVVMDALSFENLSQEYEKFSPDKDWMPKVVLMAKTVLVWLDQLTKKYKRPIERLDQIPDEELDLLKNEGFTGLWLIGLWERSYASKRIKQINGNPEAAASAYSLLDYEIAGNLGGWSALENLRKRLWIRGIRLASDMVPNHTGMDGKWVIEHPNYFVTTKDNPFPQYVYNGENLSQDGRVSIYLEDHYYSKSDCAVCFKRVDNQTGDVTYIYHGNDGTGMPWNDTAQIDFLNPEAREAVMQQILKVAANFPIIRFDAAMVLAKKHIRRLWYPEPGHGGDIATRSQYALTTDEFNSAIPNEFWREVVDRCAKEMPDTLLLAEAFWMMEGYFTRTLGMHRVYNSAFMNMLKKEENQKYRDTVKNTIKFDPQVLKRFVNFMNNPDEETAVAQFGDGDKYFGVCTLMVTMPGLPMFGHGQIEGFTEKYGMEYTKAYKDETPNGWLIDRHWREIFPLMHKRYLFAQIENFLFYDVWNNGQVNENIFAYSNGVNGEFTLVFYNNKYEYAQGWIKQSCEYAVKTGSGDDDKTMVSRSLAEGLGLTWGDDHFMVFREQRSGLWFIRRSNEIISQGMYVGLKGFEAQVYMDIHEVIDDEDGKYSKLCALLNGRGCEDLEIEWEEYQYKDLYAALANFANRDFYSGLSLTFTPASDLKEKELSRPKTEDFVASFQDAALNYYSKEIQFEKMTLENLAQKNAKAEKASKASKSKKTAEPAVLTAEERFQGFAERLEKLIDIYDSYKTPKAKKPVQKELFEDLEQKKDEAKETKTYTKADQMIADLLHEKEGLAYALASFALVSHVKAELLLKWGYARKFEQYIREAELETKENVRDVLRRTFTLHSISAFSWTGAKEKDSAYRAAELIALGKDSRYLCGANEFNHVIWFNKERMDSTLDLGFAFLAAVAPKSLKEKLFSLYRILKDCQEKAEYKCQNFVDPLETEEIKSAKAKAAAKAKEKAEKEAAKAKEKAEKEAAKPKEKAKKDAAKAKEKAVKSASKSKAKTTEKKSK